MNDLQKRLAELEVTHKARDSSPLIDLAIDTNDDVALARFEAANDLRRQRGLPLRKYLSTIPS